MPLRIFDEQGQQVDEKGLVSPVPASLSNPSSGGRLRSAGNDLAQQTVSYVLRRASGRF